MQRLISAKNTEGNAALRCIIQNQQNTMEPPDLCIAEVIICQHMITDRKQQCTNCHRRTSRLGKVQTAG